MCKASSAGAAAGGQAPGGCSRPRWHRWRRRRPEAVGHGEVARVENAAQIVGAGRIFLKRQDLRRSPFCRVSMGEAGQATENPYTWYTQGVCHWEPDTGWPRPRVMRRPAPRPGRAWAGMTILAVTAAI